MMYRAKVKRDESGMWIARVAGLAGVHTNAKRLDTLSTRVAEAISLALDSTVSADDVVIEIDYADLGLAAAAAEAIFAATKARVALATAQREAEEASLAAARTLTSQGFSLRDIGTLVGMSHQRIHQLLH